jgi:hypothetical protein
MGKMIPNEGGGMLTTKTKKFTFIRRYIIMPRKDGTGPKGTGPKSTNQGVPKRDGSGTGGNRIRGGRGGGRRGK